MQTKETAARSFKTDNQFARDFWVWKHLHMDRKHR